MIVRRAVLFKSMKRLDQLFVPGGDPGNLTPRTLMTFLSDVAATLRSVHSASSNDWGAMTN